MGDGASEISRLKVTDGLAASGGRSEARAAPSEDGDAADDQDDDHQIHRPGDALAGPDDSLREGRRVRRGGGRSGR